MSTIRQKIIECLKEKPHDALSLSQILRISQRMVETHLPHVAATAKTMGLNFVIIPAQCKQCDYKFTGREKFTKPSKCPICKSEEIYLPMFEIGTQRTQS